jgi:hypothetical protein
MGQETNNRGGGNRLGGGPDLASVGWRSHQEELMKTTTKMRKITVRRTGDIRLTSAPCDHPYVARV